MERPIPCSFEGTDGLCPARRASLPCHLLHRADRGWVDRNCLLVRDIPICATDEEVIAHFKPLTPRIVDTHKRPESKRKNREVVLEFASVHEVTVVAKALYGSTLANYPFSFLMPVIMATDHPRWRPSDSRHALPSTSQLITMALETLAPVTPVTPSPDHYQHGNVSTARQRAFTDIQVQLSHWREQNKPLDPAPPIVLSPAASVGGAVNSIGSSAVGSVGSSAVGSVGSAVGSVGSALPPIPDLPSPHHSISTPPPLVLPAHLPLLRSPPPPPPALILSPHLPLLRSPPPPIAFPLPLPFTPLPDDIDTRPDAAEPDASPCPAFPPWGPPHPPPPPFAPYFPWPYPPQIPTAGIMPMPWPPPSEWHHRAAKAFAALANSPGWEAP